MTWNKVLVKLSHARYITNIGTHLVVSYRAVATDARRSDEARRIERDVLVSASIVVKVEKMVGGTVFVAGVSYNQASTSPPQMRFI